MASARKLNWCWAAGCIGWCATRATNTVSKKGKIGAGNASGISEVESQRAVAEEGTQTFEGGCEIIGVGCGERVGCDLSILSSKIADLAGLWEGGVAWRFLEAQLATYLA